MVRSRSAVVAALTALLLCASVGLAVAKEPTAPASPADIRAYHDSGEWAKDTASQLKLAGKDLVKALTVKKGAKKPKGTPTLVLDIDDTSLSTYACADPQDFSTSASAGCIAAGKLPVIKGTLDLARTAIKKKVKLVFITARPDIPALRDVTESNLQAAGFTMKHTLTMKATGTLTGPSQTAAQYKTAARKALTKQGARIVLNVGDQKSDLSGGFSQYAVKLPNPMYVNK